MTTRRNVPVPLTPENATGNGVPSTEDLIQTQNAILQSNAAVLGAVSEFRKGMDQRLNRQFGAIASDFGVIKGQLERVDGRIGCLEQARLTDAALAEQAKAFRTAQHTDDVHVADVDRADAQAHVMSRNARAAVFVAACTGTGALLLSPGFAALLANIGRLLLGH